MPATVADEVRELVARAKLLLETGRAKDALEASKLLAMALRVIDEGGELIQAARS